MNIFFSGTPKLFLTELLSCRYIGQNHGVMVFVQSRGFKKKGQRLSFSKQEHCQVCTVTYSILKSACDTDTKSWSTNGEMHL